MFEQRKSNGDTVSGERRTRFDEKPSSEKQVELLSEFKSNIEEGSEMDSTGFAERHGVDACHGNYKILMLSRLLFAS